MLRTVLLQQDGHLVQEELGNGPEGYASSSGGAVGCLFFDLSSSQTD